jgi:predicted patatin/cPLA2 family phospholipase
MTEAERLAARLAELKAMLAALDHCLQQYRQIRQQIKPPKKDLQ